MTNAHISELALLAMGAVGLAVMFAREYRSLEAVSLKSALADTPAETIRRAIVLSLKYRFSSAHRLDEATADEYHRFRRVIDLLTMLVAINLFMLTLVGIGLFMAFSQSSPQTQIRSEDMGLIASYCATFVVGYTVIDRLYDAIKDRQPNSVATEIARERSFKPRVFRTLQPQAGHMRKPILGAIKINPFAEEAQPTSIYTGLSEAERAGLHKDPEAVKLELIAAGILDADGEIRDVYKRES